MNFQLGVPPNSKLQHQRRAVVDSFLGKLAKEILKPPPPFVVPSAIDLEGA